MKTTFFNRILAVSLPAALVFATTASYAQSQACIETNGVKFVLLPNTDGGLDVKASRDAIVLADDFLCTNAGPITDIHLWGSWLSDNHGTITNIWLAIYNDIPAVTNPASAQITPSHPGTNLLWQQFFGPGQFAEEAYATGTELFYNPTNNLIEGNDTEAWYYCFYPTNPFVQQGSMSVPTNYWLAVSAKVGLTAPVFGWKTSLTPYNDGAVWGTITNFLPTGNWQTMTNPQTLKQIDLSFKLNTPTNPPGPVAMCVETNGVKTVQGPNTLGGYDVWNVPYVLADDFKCTNIGPVSDIHLWGSWLDDLAITNTIVFWLGIYDDVQPSPGSSFSHPGTNLLWQEWFAPGQYAETIWTANASEQFFDPGQSSILGPDSIVWYYCFNPTNAFEQLGTTTAPKTYWLAAYAQMPAGIPNHYGWKTTTNVQNDVSVNAVWPGAAPTNNPGWTPTRLPTGAPLDLAFKLTTPTNICGPLQIQYLTTNKVVLTWTSGFLQVSTNYILISSNYSLIATNVQGPYIDVPGATPPYTNDTTLMPIKFYRVRCPEP